MLSSLQFMFASSCLAKVFISMRKIGLFSANEISMIFVQVGAQSAQMKMTDVPIHGGLSWDSFNEETASTEDSSFAMTGLLEQINTTRDVSDYLWYSTE